MLYGAAVKQNEVKHFRAFINVFLPLGLLVDLGRLGHLVGRLANLLGLLLLLGELIGLGAKVLEQTHKSFVLDVRCL